MCMEFSEISTCEHFVLWKRIPFNLLLLLVYYLIALDDELA